MDSNFLFRNSDIVDFPDGETLLLLVRMDEDSKTSSLILKKSGEAEGKVIYSTEERVVIFDFQVVDHSSTLKVVWRETENILFGASTCHYAEIKDDLTIISHHIFSSEAALPQHFTCFRAVLQSDYLVMAMADTVQKRIVISSFNLSDYSLISPPTVLDSYAINAAYLDSRQSYSANIKLIVAESGALYLQFLLASGTLRVFSVTDTDKSSGIIVDRLFDFAFDDVGYHNCIIDEAGKMMIVVFSGQKSPEENNNIYIASQNIFLSDKHTSTTHFTRMSTPTIVNQSQGSFWRPNIILNNSNYLVAWESNELHYTLMDANFDIAEPEAVLTVVMPGNILLHQEKYFSCQTETQPYKDFGNGYDFSEILIKMEDS